jgi:hypothetical protein
MKTNYKRFFEEDDNSLSELTDSTIPEKIVDFIIKTPFPKDHAQVHSFAEGLGIEPDKLEQYVYAFLTVIFTGGKSKGVFISKDIEQMAYGERIESEHVDLATDNKVVEKIQLLIKHKITNDHLNEDSEYYSAELFQKEMKKEDK